MDGVIDGIQFTLPRMRIIKRARRGQFAGDSRGVCIRRCYVQARRKRGVARQIAGIKDYFAGYKTQVRFVSSKRLAKLQQNKGHKGRIVFAGATTRMQFELVTQCNATLTAQIMLAYAKIVASMQEDGLFGAFTCLDIPLRYFCKGGEL